MYKAKGTFVNAEVYCENLKVMKKKIKDKRKGMLIRDVSLFNDNARLRTARHTQDMLMSFGLDIMTLPPIYRTWHRLLSYFH